MGRDRADMAVEGIGDGRAGECVAFLYVLPLNPAVYCLVGQKADLNTVQCHISRNGWLELDWRSSF